MANQDIRRVGIVGLGKMGLPIGRHLVQRGFAVTGYDVALSALKAAASAGMQAVNSPKAVAAASELVIVVVGFDSEVETVMFGDNGAIAGASDGLVVAIASTIAPATMVRIAARLPKSPRVALLDIPLCRGEGPAQTGELLIMGGGDREAFDACRPAFSAFANSIHHLGPVGAGQVGKMVNNLILWSCISANEEGFKLAQKLGVERETLRTALLEFERRQLVAGDATGREADAVGREGYDYRTQRGRRRPLKPADVRRGEGGDQDREDGAQLADAESAGGLTSAVHSS